MASKEEKGFACLTLVEIWKNDSADLSHSWLFGRLHLTHHHPSICPDDHLIWSWASQRETGIQQFHPHTPLSGRHQELDAIIINCFRSTPQATSPATNLDLQDATAMLDIRVPPTDAHRVPLLLTSTPPFALLPLTFPTNS
jgi:hypothetical protein